MEHKDLLELLESKNFLGDLKYTVAYCDWKDWQDIICFEYISLADLAFRLRDEVNNFDEGLTLVFEHLEGFSAYKEMFYWLCGLRGSCSSKHWIVTALIARRLEKNR